MSSPWPEVEAYRNRVLKQHDTDRVFSYHQCAKENCLRWFPSERPKTAPSPLHCPLHDASAIAQRNSQAAKARSGKKAGR